MLKQSNAFQIRQWLKSLKVKGNTLNEAVQVDVNKYVNAYISNIGDEKYQQAVSSIMRDELNLLNNTRFNAFAADVAINTMDVSESKNGSETLRLPVLDRFINLFLTLKDPNFILKNNFAKQQLLNEMEMVYNGSTSQIESLIENPEFVLRY